MSFRFSRSFRSAVLTGSALGAMLAAGSAQAAEAAVAAESAAAEAGPGLSDIVVTAQKRETSLQTTPISIAVMNTEDLRNRHVVSLESLMDGSIPSLRVAPMFSRSSALTVGMRGIGTMGDANQPSRDQGVGVYIDGVFLGRAQGLGSALYDVERIEVLKGPQGSLFGRNTEGGAISIVTRKPSGEWGLRATAGIGNYGAREASAHLDLPAVANISVKLDALITRRDGTVDNPLAGAHDFNAYNKRGLHAAALWQPSSSFSALYSFDISQDRTTPYYVQLLSGGSYARAPLIQLQPDRASEANIGVPQAWSTGKTHGHMVTLDWNLSEAIEVKSISSYRELTQTQLDNGMTNITVFAPNANFSRYSLANVWQHQYSQEVQVIGTLPEVDFVAGGFYYHEHVRDDAWTPNTNKWNADGTGYTVLPDPVASSAFPDRASRADTDSIGVFGQATWSPHFLNDKAHLMLGGRYTHDKKSGSLDKVNGVATAYLLDESWDRFDPTINLAYDLADDIHVYGKWSTGYKAGGANSRSLTYRAFKPESVSSFEVGAKTEFLDRHVRLNLAAWTAAYKDVQIDFYAPVASSNRTTTETTNAEGQGRSKGVEAELTVMPMTGLTLSGSYTYTDMRLPEAPNPFVTGNPLMAVYPVFTPKHAASGAFDYQTELGDATLRFHLDANYSSKQYAQVNDPTRSQSAFLVNGRVALSEIEMPGIGAKMELSVWSRNLFNKAYTYLRSYSSAIGQYGIYNEPRTYGISSTVQF
ncbi:TonB-dependent receptor [Novosphingobium aerophilum]|uniref:TonB-dependent receptor n=1 Tax=Novosphingobium aerophilum TaxID=2839843 RepID=UPI003FD62F94